MRGRKLCGAAVLLAAAMSFAGCSGYASSQELREQAYSETGKDGDGQAVQEGMPDTERAQETGINEDSLKYSSAAPAEITVNTANRTQAALPEFEEVSSGQKESAVGLDSGWKYAAFAKITSGSAVLYKSDRADRKNITVCVNAGHGTKGGSAVKTQCHPDGSPKVTGGTTGAGAVTAAAVSGGMTFSDGTPESRVTLSMARILKEKLLAKGYDVLMIRESDDVQLDNIARTVIANNASDCHIALHWDSTTNNKGAFYMSVPSNQSYRNMVIITIRFYREY